MCMTCVASVDMYVDRRLTNRHICMFAGTVLPLFPTAVGDIFPLPDMTDSLSSNSVSYAYEKWILWKIIAIFYTVVLLFHFYNLWLFFRYGLCFMDCFELGCQCKAIYIHTYIFLLTLRERMISTRCQLQHVTHYKLYHFKDGQMIRHAVSQTYIYKSS